MVTLSSKNHGRSPEENGQPPTVPGKTRRSNESHAGVTSYSVNSDIPSGRQGAAGFPWPAILPTGGRGHEGTGTTIQSYTRIQRFTST